MKARGNLVICTTSATVNTWSALLGVPGDTKLAEHVIPSASRAKPEKRLAGVFRERRKKMTQNGARRTLYSVQCACKSCATVWRLANLLNAFTYAVLVSVISFFLYGVE